VSGARSLSVMLGVALRSARKLLKSPAFMLPPLVIPLFFFAAFIGAFSSLGETPGFEYYDYTAFEFVFVLYQSAALAGVFTSLEIASDFGTGMGRRLMSATPHRTAIVAGYLMPALGRCALAITVVWAVAVIIGMPVRGDVVDIAGLIALALLLSVATTLYGAGVALRLKSTAAGVLIMIPVFMAVFLTPVFIPRDQLSGWLEAVASVNPLTPLLEAGRGFLADDPVSVGISFAAGFGLVIVFAVWAAFGMRKAEQTA
jgi:ABC-2 type transport system permease protein